MPPRWMPGLPSDRSSSSVARAMDPTRRRSPAGTAIGIHRVTRVVAPRGCADPAMDGAVTLAQQVAALMSSVPVTHLIFPRKLDC